MASVNLTPKELELLKAIGKYINTAAVRFIFHEQIKYVLTSPQVDWAKIAEETDFPTPKRARDKWYPLRDKLFGAGGGDDASTPKKKTAPKRKAGESMVSSGSTQSRC